MRMKMKLLRMIAMSGIVYGALAGGGGAELKAVNECDWISVGANYIPHQYESCYEVGEACIVLCGHNYYASLGACWPNESGYYGGCCYCNTR
jgi:hypothetical protein